MFFNKDFQRRYVDEMVRKKEIKERWTRKTILRKLFGKKFISVCSHIHAFLYPIKIFLAHSLYKKINIPYLEVVLTTRCTLSCKDCANLMPYFNKNNNYDITFENYKSNLDKLLEFVESIQLYRILGGEPLLHKNFAEIIDYAASQKKLKNICIVTNGTVPFSQKVLNVLSSHKGRFFIVISNYSSNKDLILKLKHDEIISNLIQHNIPYYMEKALLEWWEMGEIYPRNRSQEENKKIFKTCGLPCVSMMGKEIHVCPVSSSLAKLKDSSKFKDDFINIDEITNENAFEKFVDFYSKDYFSVCDYCSDKSIIKSVPPAVQTISTLKFKS